MNRFATFNTFATSFSMALAIIALLSGCMGPDARVGTDRAQFEADTVVEESAPAVTEGDFVEKTQPLPQDEAAPPLILGPGDLLDIEVFGEKGTRETCLVGVDGRLFYGPLAGFKVAGLQVPEIKTALETQLTDWYRRPTVLITVLEVVSRRATVLGRVSTPGSVRLRGGERVLDLLAAAGGLATSRFSGSTEELADLSGALLVRKGVVLPVDFHALVKEGDTRHNVIVHPGDHLYVPSSLSREVYVVGAVGLPKTVGFSQGLTLARAVAMAGGGTPDAYMDRVLVVRGTAAKPSAVRVDVTEIIAGNEPDLLLQPKDVIWVPGRTADNPQKLMELGARSFVSSAFASAGARAWDETSPTIITVTPNQ